MKASGGKRHPSIFSLPLEEVRLGTSTTGILSGFGLGQASRTVSSYFEFCGDVML